MKEILGLVSARIIAEREKYSKIISVVTLMISNESPAFAEWRVLDFESGNEKRKDQRERRQRTDSLCHSTEPDIYTGK
jgi:hypothetical protein